MLRSLVGSEMCIRDRREDNAGLGAAGARLSWDGLGREQPEPCGVGGIVFNVLIQHLKAFVDGCRMRRADRCGMCVLLRCGRGDQLGRTSCVVPNHSLVPMPTDILVALRERLWVCLLYTSDAADEEDSVDLGGRRIIKKKK
eukprot:TRINITY_DN50745_c0_g1_i1.p2 TRINITY_DN50745_c0_g1~~TRINITY_DN50745_c0_g1_i1.p2  ORF type:complete len:142 (+),score=28.50 TRINITY_DN50745_c0_g1_i1:95-520(+)